MDSKERNGRNGKKELKNYVFLFRMNIRKIRTVLRNAPGMRNWCWCIFHFAQSCKIVRAHAKLYFSIFFGEEASKRPLRWCQVSTWPWPINRNLIYSFWERYIHFLIVEFSRFPLSIEFSTFLNFLSLYLIFSLAKHALWDQISKHEWLNLVFLGEWRI